MRLERMDDFQLIGTVAPSVKGQWQEDVQYEYMDVVYENGCSWIARTKVPQGKPDLENTDWQIVALGYPDADKLVRGVKGEAELEYRTGNVNITKDDLGLDKVDNVSYQDVLNKAVRSVSYNGLNQKFTGDIDLPMVTGIIYNGQPVKTGVIRVNTISGISFNDQEIETGVIATDIVTGITFNGERSRGEININAYNDLSINGNKINNKDDLALVTKIRLDGVELPLEDGTVNIETKPFSTIIYAECESESTEQQKVIACEDTVVSAGFAVTVKFKKENTAYPLSLVINKNDPIEITIKGNPIDESTASLLAQNGTYLFVYNGETFELITLDTTAAVNLPLTISVDDWNLDDEPRYTIENDLITANNQVTITPAKGKENYLKAAKLNLYEVSQENGKITIGALYEPTEDVEINVRIM